MRVKQQMWEHAQIELEERGETPTYTFNGKDTRIEQVLRSRLELMRREGYGSKQRKGY